MTDQRIACRTCTPSATFPHLFLQTLSGREHCIQACAPALHLHAHTPACPRPSHTNACRHAYVSALQHQARAFLICVRYTPSKAARCMRCACQASTHPHICPCLPLQVTEFLCQKPWLADPDGEFAANVNKMIRSLNFQQVRACGNGCDGDSNGKQRSTSTLTSRHCRLHRLHSCAFLVAAMDIDGEGEDERGAGGGKALLSALCLCLCMCRVSMPTPCFSRCRSRSARMLARPTFSCAPHSLHPFARNTLATCTLAHFI